MGYQQMLSATQQYQQIAINAQTLQPTPTPQYATPQNTVTRFPGDQTNREYLQMLPSIAIPGEQQQQQHAQRLLSQRVTSQGQRLSNPDSRRGGVSAGLSIDTERAQQQLVARFLEGAGGRNQPGAGSANTSPMPTPTSLQMASPQYGPMQQPQGGSASRRNSQVQLQRQAQLINTGRRAPSTPTQQSFIAPPPQQLPGQPVHHRHGYIANPSQPIMVSDAILNAHAQIGPPGWSDGTPMPSAQMPQMPNQVQSMQSMQSAQQQHPQRSSLHHSELVSLFVNGLPQQGGVRPIPIPIPIRISYAGLPQHTLQSHLLSPRFVEPPRVNGRAPPRSKLYISITRFAFPGVVVDFKKASQKVKFDVEEGVEKRLSKMRLGNKPGDGLMRPMVVPGALIYRLRAIRWTGESVPESPDKEWVARETDWPSNTFIEINGNRVELRRKPAWGKDLPADITTHIRTGENEIRIVVLRPRQSTPVTILYAMAVEVHECSHENDIVNGLNHISPTDAKTLITSRLVTKDDGDDLMVVDSDELSLAVTCPLSFTLMNIPVRARSCPHIECFDFKNFLDSRPRRKEWEPPNSDAWRCPICRGDARPGELVIDGFLEGVLKTLRETDAGGEDPRHIIVKKDGSWEVKNEKDTSNEKEEKDNSGNGTGNANPKKDVEIICLDDDDD